MVSRLKDNRLLTFARLAWLFIVGLQIIIFILGLFVWIPALRQACYDGFVACQRLGLLTPGDIRGLSLNGWTLQGYVWVQILGMTLPKFFGILVGFLIFWRNPLDRMAWVASLFLALGVERSVANWLVIAHPAWLLPTSLLWFLGILCFGLFFYLFPNGHFQPRWTIALSAVFALMGFLLAFFQGSPLDPNKWGAIAGIIFGMIVVTFILAQIIRYRRISNPTEKIQIKWVIIAIVISLIALMASLSVVLRSDPGVRITRYWWLLSIGFSLQSYLIPLAIGISILRYRLWDIDIIIRKTLVYGALTALLGLIFFGGVTVLQRVFQTITGQQSAVSIVISTLAIAALFNPLRRRIQNGIDRRFYRRKYNAEKALAKFTEMARNETDIERLSSEILSVVQETMQPDRIRLWMKK